MSKRCSEENRSGKRCGAWAVSGVSKCALHLDPERAARIGSKHGRKQVLPSQAAAAPSLCPTPTECAGEL
jgi:hypothetical protein